MIPLTRKNSLLLLLMTGVLLLSTAPARALQVIEAADGVTVAGKMSAKEVTRIAVAGGRITDMFGSEGRIEVKKDEAQGQIFVRLLTEGMAPVNVFVVDGAGRTYTLVLVPTDIPAETVLIKPLGAPGSTTQGARNQKRTASYQKAVKTLIRQMAHDGVPDAYEVRERKTTIPLWKEVRFVLEREYVGETFRGESYTLVNASGSDLVMTPQEFYRPGLLAAAPVRLVLGPGQTTQVFLVHERGIRND
jgi:conjugal transfer pilus assembly protein TraK